MNNDKGLDNIIYKFAPAIESTIADFKFLVGFLSIKISNQQYRIILDP